MNSLKDLKDLSAGMDASKTDYKAQVSDLSFAESGQLLVPAGGPLFNGEGSMVGLAPTVHAMAQICEKLGPPPGRYIIQCPGWLQATNLNHWREQLPPDREWFVRAYKEDCRAVLSDRYVPIGNTFLLDTAIEMTGDQYPVVQPYITPDSLHVKIRVMGANGGGNGNGGGEYAFGVYLGNGEIGNRALRVLPFIQRHACTNSIILQEGYTQNHIHVSEAFIRANVKEFLGRGLKVARDALDRIWKAEEEQIPDFNAIVKDLARARGLSEEVRENILVGSEGQKTRMGLVNGLTWAAHQQGNMETQIDMETLAGGILVSEDSLFGRAPRQVQYAEVLADQRQDERGA